MKARALIGIAAGLLFAGIMGMAVAAAPHGESDGRDGRDDDGARIRRGLDYARQQGIALNFKGHDKSQVGLGSYLVNAVGGCNDCHTAPPYTKDPYAYLGAPSQVNLACYLAGGTEFGPFVSRDITPWEDGKPAGLTFRRFLHVMRTGEDPDNPGQLLQVMPWSVYQSMTDQDLRAIYEYLSSIPAIPANTCGTPSE